MMLKYSAAFLAAVLGCGAATIAPASAAIIVGGDITGAFKLGPDEFGGVAGNRIFFDRVRAGAARVAISGDSFSPEAVQRLQSFYGFTSGAEVVTLSGTIDTAGLAGAGLLVIAEPDGTFTASEKAAIGAFARGGGNVLLLGEASQTQRMLPLPPVPEGTRANLALNDLLAGIGATIRLSNDSIFGSNDQLTTDVRANPLTAGITSFGYGFVSSVTGGTPLFGASLSFMPTGPYLPFFATETLGAGVPEPAAWALLIGGFGLLGAAARRRSSARISEAVPA